MELTNELKLLLIKTEAHKDDSAAQGVFDTIKNMSEINEEEAYNQRLNSFYSQYRDELDLGTIDSANEWTEPTADELKVALTTKVYVEAEPIPIWQVEGYANEDAYEANLYAEQRKKEYPPIGDQLDALFHAGVFPQEMADKIQAVKDAHPKP